MSITKCISSRLVEESDFNYINHVMTSLIDIFEWCDELDVVMTLGINRRSREYFINLNKDKYFKSVYISRNILTQNSSYVYDLVLNAVKELNVAISEDVKGE